MNTKHITIFAIYIFLASNLIAEPIITFKSGQKTLSIPLPAEVSLSRGLVRGGTGRDDLSYQRFVLIRVFEEVIDLKKFTELQKGKKIDVYLYGKKIASPWIHEIIKDGELSIYIPTEKEFLKIENILQKSLKIRTTQPKPGDKPDPNPEKKTNE